MSGEMAVSLALKFKDQGSTQATQALQKITRATKETGDVAKSASAAAMSAFQKLANARETLGIRSEKAIQNEIRQTEAAYKRLSSSGQASARELGRAQDAMRQKVSDLRRELDGVNRSFGGRGALQTAGALFGAGAAAKMTLQGPVSRTMNYGMELAHSSNTIFAGRSVAERIAGKTQINDAVMAGVRAAKGGVTREDALLGMKTLGASGQFGDEPQAAFAMLPTLTKAAAANNASVVDMANIAIKAKQTMGLGNAARVLNIATQGGIEGQFELRNMAQYLPKQMAYARTAGLTGEKGFATLVAANQLAMTTAGSADEAGNNMLNLLAKINSPDTANDAKALGIDLSGALAAAKAKGVDGLTAFMNLAEQQAAKDPRLVKLREQARSATGADLKENLDGQLGILMGSSMGKLLQDRQAMSALVANLNGRQQLDQIRDNSLAAGDPVSDMLQLIENEPAAKAQLAVAEAANNTYEALSKVNPLIGVVADGFSKLSQEFPALMAALQGVTLAGTTAGAAAAGGALGGAVAAGGLGAAAGQVGSFAARIGTGIAGAATTAASYAPHAALVAGAGAAGYGAGTILNKGINGVVSWATGREDETLGGLIYDWTHKDRSTSGPASQQSAPQVVKVEVEVKNGNIVASVNEENSWQAMRD